MAEDHHLPSRLHRRSVLKAALWTAGAVTAAPLFAASRSTWDVGDSLKVGVLLPQASRYPALGANLLAGMQVYLAQAARIGSPSITLLPTTYQRSMSAMQQATQTLIEQDNIDLVVGAFDSQMAARLRSMLEQNRVPLIVADTGANAIRAAARSEYIIYSTLNAWQTSWVVGDWTARNIGRTAVIAAACYESGYDSLYTFELGFTGGGGTVRATHITHAPGRTDDLPALMKTIAQAQPHLVYGLYSGSEAADFVAAYAASPLAGRVPLFGSEFLVADTVVLTDGVKAAGIQSGSTWAPLDTRMQRQFTAAYQQHAKRPADSFAALGYDTARLIVEAARLSDRKAQLPDALAEVSFVGPRGRVQIDPSTRSVTTPIYLRSSERADPSAALSTIATLATIREDDDHLAPLLAAPETGWLHPYLIV